MESRSLAPASEQNKSVVEIRRFFVTRKRQTAAFERLAVKKYRPQNKAAHIERKRPKSPRNYTAGNGFGRFCVSGANRQIGSAKRRWTLCPVCRNTSSKNGRSFLMSVAGRNTTSFAGNAKGAASRATVKTAQKSAKTAQQTSKAAIKTAEATGKSHKSGGADLCKSRPDHGAGRKNGSQNPRRCCKSSCESHRVRGQGHCRSG